MYLSIIVIWLGWSGSKNRDCVKEYLLDRSFAVVAYLEENLGGGTSKSGWSQFGCNCYLEKRSFWGEGGGGCVDDDDDDEEEEDLVCI